MIVTFRSKETADILMLGEHALKILQAIGRDYQSVPAKGVISPEQMPEAIQALKLAMHEDSIANPEDYASHDKQVEQQEQAGQAPVHPISQPVVLRKRAYPLLEMMKLALKDNESVVWEEGNAW